MGQPPGGGSARGRVPYPYDATAQIARYADGYTALFAVASRHLVVLGAAQRHIPSSDVDSGQSDALYCIDLRTVCIGLGHRTSFLDSAIRCSSIRYRRVDTAFGSVESPILRCGILLLPPFQWHTGALSLFSIYFAFVRADDDFCLRFG